MVRICLTGGPCAGKSVVLDFLRQEYASYYDVGMCSNKIMVMREVASHLFDNLFPLAGRELTYSDDWREILQRTILPVQMNTESAMLMAAKESGTSALIMDRGILDGAAYMGGSRCFCETFGLDLAEIYDRYDMVIHIESLACGNPCLYEGCRHSNPNRRETLLEAQEMDSLTQEAWSKHPNWVFIPNRGNLRDVQLQIFKLISPLIDKQLERKFWLHYLPNLNLGEGVVIKQGYIISDNIGELRLKKAGDEYTITVKTDGKKLRGRWERNLPQHLFDVLWPATEIKQLNKVRHTFKQNNIELKLDIYHGDHGGLIILEASSSDEEALSHFELPAWASDAIEVTDLLEFKNKVLAREGLPDMFRDFEKYSDRRKS